MEDRPRSRSMQAMVSSVHLERRTTHSTWDPETVCTLSTYFVTVGVPVASVVEFGSRGDHGIRSTPPGRLSAPGGGPPTRNGLRLEYKRGVAGHTSANLVWLSRGTTAMRPGTMSEATKVREIGA